MTKEEVLIAKVMEAIHNGLGGNGWAYTNYGGDEMNSCKAELREAAICAIEAVDGYNRRVALEATETATGSPSAACQDQGAK